MSACSCRRGLSFLGRGLPQSQGIIGQFEVTRTAGDAQAVIKSPVAPVAFDVGLGVNPHLLGEIGFLLLLRLFHWGLRELYTGRAANKKHDCKRGAIKSASQSSREFRILQKLRPNHSLFSATCKRYFLKRFASRWPSAERKTESCRAYPALSNAAT